MPNDSEQREDRVLSRNAAPLSAGYLRYALLVLTLANVVNYMDRSIVGVLIEPMRAELALSDTQLGVLSGLAFALFYAIAGIYIAHLADVRGRVIVISWAIAIWSAMTALSGVAHNYWQLLLARMGVGIGEAGVIPAANAIIADYYAPTRRPFALAVFTSGAMLGVAAGSFVGGAIAAQYGWRWAFVGAALPGLPLAWLVWRTLREPARDAADDNARTTSNALGSALRVLLTNAQLVYLILGYAFIVFLLFGVITWFPAFLVRHHGMSLMQVGASFGTAIGVGTAVGAVSGGALASRLAARDHAWITRLPVLLLLVIWPLYEIAIFAPSGAASIVAVAVVSMFGGAAYGPVLAAMQTTLHPSMRSTGAAVNGFIGSLVGVGGGPLLVGMVSDHYSAQLGAGVALQRGLAIAVCAGLIGAVFLWLAHRAFLAARESSNA